MQLVAIVNEEPRDRLRAADVVLLSGGELFVVADAFVVYMPVLLTLLTSLDVCTGYRRDAIVCVSLGGGAVDEEPASPNADVEVKNAVMEDEYDDTCFEPGSLRGLKPA